MQGYKPNYRGDRGDRGDARPRQRGGPDQGKPYGTPTHGSHENAAEVAARALNLKLLQSVVEGDTAVLAIALDMATPRLQAMLDGQVEVDSGLAMHLETTLGLPPRWLDKKHVVEDIGEETKKILRGEKTSEVAEALHAVEQHGHAIMKKTDATNDQQPHSAGAQASDADVRTVEDLGRVRVGNLELLTGARGAKTKMAKAVSVSESFISFLFNGKKEFTSTLARSMETAVGLPRDWMDWEHKVEDVPQAAWDVLGKPAPRKDTTPVVRKQKPAPAPVPTPAPVAADENEGTSNMEFKEFAFTASPAPSVLGSSAQSPQNEAPAAPASAAKPPAKQGNAPSPSVKPAAKADTRKAPGKTDSAKSQLAGKTKSNPSQPKSSELQLELPTAAASVLDASVGRTPGSATIASAPTAAPALAPLAATSAPSVIGSAASAPAASAPVAPAPAAPAPAEATPAAEAAPPQPVGGRAVAMAALPTSLENSVDILPPASRDLAALQLLEPDVLGIGLAAHALIKLLLERARENKLPERDAWRMFGQLSGFVD